MWLEITLRSVGVFSSAAAVDYLLIQWYAAVAARQKLRAIAASVLSGALGLFSFGSFVDQRWYALPWLLGLAAGTLWAMCDKKDRT